MAAATALAIASAAAGGIQAIVGGIQRNKAERAARRATRGKRGVIEEGVMNQYAGLQAPKREFDIATQRTQADIADKTRMLQEMGPEGAANVANLVLAGHQAELETAAKREAAGFEVDKMKAAEQARIDQMKYQGLVGLSQQELMGAQAASAEGRQAMNLGFGGITAGLAEAPGAYISDRDAKNKK